MGDIPCLGRLLGCVSLLSYTNPSDWFDKRDEIKVILQDHLSPKSALEWLAILEPADVWCAEVLDYDMLIKQDGYKVLEMEQEVSIGNKFSKTTRCPIRVDGKILKSGKGAPSLGEHTMAIRKEFDL
jgi:crotonobetainyl-CoA:carnitine CoA-transferase CaiB-like acyl-CoA transferase